jgi:hypothetical protein
MDYQGVAEPNDSVLIVAGIPPKLIWLRTSW